MAGIFTPQMGGFNTGINDTNYTKPCTNAIPSITRHVHISYEDLGKRLSNASGIIKLYMSACNNATYIILGNALDSLKKHPVWAQKFHPAKGQFTRAIKEFKAYENKLIYARQNRYFCLDNMPENIRKKYGDISTREYYDYWCAIGASNYMLSLPQINALKYKYERSLREQNCEHAKILAEAFLAQAALMLSVAIFEEQMVRAAEDTAIPLANIKRFFSCFSLEKVADCWHKGLEAMAGKELDYDLPDQTARNIELGIEQLAIKWSDGEALFDVTIDATESYQEVFRTKGEWKKALRLIHETKQELTDIK